MNRFKAILLGVILATMVQFADGAGRCNCREQGEPGR